MHMKIRCKADAFIGNMFRKTIIPQKNAKHNKNIIKVVNFVEIAYFSCADIAKMTGRKLSTVQKWCSSGKLKASRPGGRDYLIKKSDFEAFMESDNRNAGE